VARPKPDATVEVNLNGQTYTTTANSTGDYSVTVPLADALVNGTYTPNIKVTDAAGNTSTVPGRAFTVDTSAPTGQTGALTAAAPHDSGTLGDNLTSTTTPEISGVAEAGAAVEVTVNGKTYSTTANSTGDYSVIVPGTNALLNGTYTPSIKVTDAAGNSSTVSGTPFTVDTSAPTGQTGALAAASDTGVRNHITSNTTPEISGKTEPDAAVEVTLNGKTYTTTANSTGDYSITVPPDDALPIGSYTPSIKVTDAAGNSSTVAGTAFIVNQFNVSISAVDTDSSSPVVEQFEFPTLTAGVWSTKSLSMSYFSGTTLLADQIVNGSTIPADTGKGMEIGRSNSQESEKNHTLLVTSKIGAFTDLSFEYIDFQNVKEYSGTPTATVEFLDAAGNVIHSQDFLANTAKDVRRTFDWDNTAGHQATSFRIVELRNDFWTLDKMSFTPMGGSLPSGSTTTDTSHTLRGTLDTALTGTTQVVEIFNGTTSLGNATVTGTNWTLNVTGGSVGTRTYTAQVKDGTQVLSTSSAFTLIVASTPLVLDLNGDGVQTTSITDGTQFDLLNTGTPQSVGWVDRHDGLLAIDLNGDGHINSGAELFGDHTQLSDGSLAKDGWHALAEMDSNADGQINALDVNFDRLLLWVDANSNGISDAGELSGLAAANIASIDLAANTHSVQQNGNVVQAFSTYTTLDGRTLEVADVGFQVNPAVFASHGMDTVQPLVDPAMLNASRPML
jgi:hypothetical protein